MYYNRINPGQFNILKYIKNYICIKCFTEVHKNIVTSLDFFLVNTCHAKDRYNIDNRDKTTIIT
jgi:hypothetical protein